METCFFQDASKALAIIKTIGEAVLNKKYMRIAVNTDSDDALGHVGNFLNSIDGDCINPLEKSEETGARQSGEFFYEMPFQVS